MSAWRIQNPVLYTLRGGKGRWEAFSAGSVFITNTAAALKNLHASPRRARIIGNPFA
jgi:hypothetical protein